MDKLLRASFVQGRALSSKEIGWFGSDFFSHVDIYWHDNVRLCGARSDVIVPPGVRRPIPAGVQLRPDNYEAWDSRLVVGLWVPSWKYDLAMEFLRDQMRCPYDRGGIWQIATGRINHRDWRDNATWFCSELFIRMLEVAFIITQMTLTPNRINPGTAACIFQSQPGAFIETALNV